MTKFEWERQLKKGLSGLPKSEQQRALEYYNELFADKIDAKMKEQEIIAEFGNPYDVANRIICDYYNEGKNNQASDEYVYSETERMDETESDAFDGFDDISAEAPQSKRDKRKVKHEEMCKHMFTRGKDDEPTSAKGKRSSGVWATMSSIAFPLVLIVYFILGGVWGLWHPWWVLFLIVPTVISLADAIVHNRPDRFCYPVFIAMLYLCIGLFFHRWHPSWILFLTIPLYYSVISILQRQKRKERLSEFAKENDEQSERDSSAKSQSVGTTQTVTRGKNVSAGRIVAAVFMSILFAVIAVVVISFVLSMFVAGVAMTIGGVVTVAAGVIALIGASGAMGLATLGAGLLICGIGLLFACGFGSLFKVCYNMCKAFVSAVKSLFYQKEAA
ncbi:MAG: DUF1700 domain-containing protein [Corallococcus sp.]|nr:DUF1700 domain-containing protein [Corallococcus sp.]